MIQINGAIANDQSVYMISFYHYNFLISQGINQRSLSNFSTHKQNHLGKIKVRIDLNHLHLLENLEKVDYVLISRYKDILIIPYLLRKNQNIKVILSKLSFELGKIHLQSFYNVIKSIDKKYSTINTQSSQQYFLQSQIKDNYERQLNIKPDSLPTIYSLNEIKETLQKCIKVNFGQELTLESGIMVKCISSGQTMGSTNWILYSLITKQSLLWISYLSQQPFKANKNSGQVQLVMPVTHIFISNTIFDQILPSSTAKQAPQQFFQNIIKKIGHNLQVSRVCKIVQQNQLSLLDYLGDLNWNLNGKFRQIFIDHDRMNHMISYCNSYVQYLADGYKNRIYIDPPEYPFQNFYSLQDKMTLWTGSIQEIAEKQKLPIKQLIARSKPYVHIIPSYKAYLFDLLDQNCLVNPLKTRIKLEEVLLMLKKCNAQNIFFYSNGMNELQIGWKRMDFGNSYRIGKGQQRYLNMKNFGNCMLSKFETINGQLFSSPVTKQYMKISKNWKQQLLLALSQRGIFSMIGNLSSQQQYLQVGQNTKIWMKNHKLHISTDEMELLKIVEECLGSISKKLKFN